MRDSIDAVNCPTCSAPCSYNEDYGWAGWLLNYQFDNTEYENIKEENVKMKAQIKALYNELKSERAAFDRLYNRIGGS
jgi:hypothetical protein